MLNNKIVAALTALLLASGVASAGVFDTTQYSLGMEMSVLNRTAYTSSNAVDINRFKSSNSDTTLVIRKNKIGFNIFANARLNQVVGFELGYGIILKVSGTAQGGNTATNKISNTYVDMLGYMPVAVRVNLIGSIGAGLLKSNANVTNVTFVNLEALNKAKIGYRVGAGAQFDIDGNWATRFMLRYQKGNSDFLKSNTSLSLGVFYMF